MIKLFKKRDNKSIIVRVEIDNEKLAKAICDEQEKRDSQKRPENELQDTIVSAILSAYQQKEKNDIEKQEKERCERIEKRTESIWGKDCFDDEGKPKKKIKIVWKFLWAKEETLKGSNILAPTINCVVAFVFLLIEWGLYITSLWLLGKGAYNIVNFFKNIATKVEWNLLNAFISNILYSVGSFLLARTLIRILKIECKYNKDNNYMLNFLAVIIAVMAIFVSII